MLDKLIEEYIKKFGEEPETNNFYMIDEKEQIKILKECIEKNEKVYENKYYNEHFIEEVV